MKRKVRGMGPALVAAVCIVALACGKKGDDGDGQAGPEGSIKSSLRVQYGPDGKGYSVSNFTAVEGYNRLTFQTNGDTLRDAWYFGPSSSVNGKWLDGDDKPAGYWYQEPGGTFGCTYDDAGPDGQWFAGVDHIQSCECFGPVVSGKAINLVTTSAGADQRWCSGDDGETVSEAIVRTVDQTGAETERHIYAAPFTDGVWEHGTPDSAGWVRNTYEAGHTIHGSWSRQERYSGDALAGYTLHTFDPKDPQHWVTELRYDAADHLLKVIRATNEY